MENSKIKLTRFFQSVKNYFQPSFTDINGQKVTKKFPFVSIIGVIASFILIILIFNKLHPDFSNSTYFFDSLKHFFEINKNATIGGNDAITPHDTLIKSLILLWKTISYSILGTIIGIFLSVPIALLSSKNFIKTPYVYFPVRAIMSIVRAVPPLVIAYMLYFVFLPELAASLAIAIFVCSLMAKWLYEDLDTYDVTSYYGLQSIGNNKWLAFKKSILPYLMKRITSYGFYSFEMVVRFAAILSVVGITTIGSLMANEYAITENFSHLSIVIWILVLFMILIEIFNWIIKKYILDYSAKHPKIDENAPYEVQLEQLKKQKPKTIYLTSFVSLIILALFIAAVLTVKFGIVNEIKLDFFKTGVKNLFHPDWTVYKWDGGENPIILGFEAFLLAIASSVIGLIIALVFGILASKKISGWVISLFFRLLIIILRAIPPFTYVSMFFLLQKSSIIWAGTLSLGIHSVGMLGKLITESVDKIDDKIFQSLDSVGASWWTKVWVGVVKQIWPQTLSNFLYRIEINFKSTVVIGAVGACKFGQQIMFYSSDINQWGKLSSYLIFTIILLIVLEQVSNLFRKKLMTGYYFDQKFFIKRYIRRRLLAKSLSICRVTNMPFIQDSKNAKYQIAKYKNNLLTVFNYSENNTKNITEEKFKNLAQTSNSLQKSVQNEYKTTWKEVSSVHKNAFDNEWKTNSHNFKKISWIRRLKQAQKAARRAVSKYFDKQSKQAA